MSLRVVRAMAAGVYLLTLCALTWPVLAMVDRLEPRILGLPFHLAWFAGWILVSFVTLVIVDRFESRADDDASPPSAG